MESEIVNSDILIVDDLPENIQVLGNILNEKGFNISMAMSGEEALESLETALPDLILLDINMPGMDGYEVCEKIKENKRTSDIPVIFLTANTETDKVVAGFEKGAVDYVTKPFQSAELLKRIETHLELKKSKERLAETIAIKDRFFKIIAHDLKSPFNALIGFSNLLVANQNITEENKETFIGIINDTSKMGLGLLENLLLWAEMQTNEYKLQREKLDLLIVANDVFQLLNISAKQKEINLQNLISEGIYIESDRQGLEMVFRNLISNAIKFTRKGGSIVVKSQVKDAHVVISISDTGVGIEKSQLENLFRIEKKLTTLGTENEVGTGLGLSLVKEFVEKNNGKIWTESTVNKGTTFFFTLDLANK